MGLTDREIDQPIIGVANSFNEFIPGHIPLDKTTPGSQGRGAPQWGHPPGVRGYRGLRRPGHAPCRHEIFPALPELIADSIEIMATAHPVDGLILVANCDKIIPGMLMAALRLNIPAI